MNKTTHKKLIRARAELVLDHPFFGCLALRLQMTECGQVPTMATDGKSLLYNADFVDGLKRSEVVGVLAHEVSHISLGHCWRMDNRDKTKWNIATDYAINDILLNTGFKLPEGRLHNESFDNLSAEEIYSLLPDQQQQDDSDGSNGEGESGQMPDPGQCGGVFAPESPAKAKEMEQEWKAAMSQAMQVAKGNMPAGLKRQIEQILNPDLPWTTLLWDFVELSARNDYNWNRPSRRFAGRNVVLPSLISEELPEVVIGYDTSGSITDKDLARFASEVSGILDAYDTTVRVIYCDAKVQKVQEFTRGDFPICLEPMGGGGTSFVPVFDYVEGEGLMPFCLIYFTDMYGTFPNKGPSYPVMWVTKTKGQSAPFGEVIVFE